MRSKLFFILSLFIISFFIFIPKSQAQTWPCSESKEVPDLIKCYEDLDITHYVWNCSGQTVIGCRQEFSKKIDEQLVALGYTWQWSSGRSATWETIMKLFDQRQKDLGTGLGQTPPTPTPTPLNTPLPTIIPTITPTPVLNSVSTYHDICKKIIISSNGCVDNLSALYSCYSDIGPEDGIWSCTDTNQGEIDIVSCSKVFSKIIRDNIKDVSNKTCNETTDKFQFDRLTDLFKNKRSVREIRLGKITPSLAPGVTIVYPSIVVTEGVVEDQIIEDANKEKTLSDDLIKDSWNTFNCGFANGVDEVDDGIDTSKNACCTNTLLDIDPDFSQDDEIIKQEDCGFWKGLFGFCELPNFSKMASDKFKSYMQDNEVTSKLNVLIQTEAQIPECFVGTCNTTTRICEPQKSAAICQRYIKDPLAAKHCEECFEKKSDNPNAKFFYSGLGCIDTSFEGIITEIFTIGLGIAGMAALGCIIYASFLMQTSQGNPESIQKAQENITSCITGLILIIFSIFILRVIGVDLLRIPGFNTTTGSSASANVPPLILPTNTNTILENSSDAVVNTPNPTAIQTVTPSLVPSIVTPKVIGTVTGNIKIGSVLYFSNNTVNPSTTEVFPGARFIYQTKDNRYLYSDSINSWVASSSVEIINGQLFQVVEVDYPNYLISNIQNTP